MRIQRSGWSALPARCAGSRFSYQSFQISSSPGAQGDPYGVGDGNKVQYWAEFLMLDHPRRWPINDHAFFGRWPAITEKRICAGHAALRGNLCFRQAATAILRSSLEKIGLTDRPALPAAVHVQHGVNRLGKRIHYYFKLLRAQK